MGGKAKKRDLATDRPLYDRQPGEPDKVWKAFVLYRDLGELRSLRAAAEKYHSLTGSKGTTKSTHEWFMKKSPEWRWGERTFAWDRTLDTRMRDQKLAQVVEMQKRHIHLGQSLQNIGAIGVRELITRLRANPNLAFFLSSKDLVRLIEAGTKLERVNMGEPETIEEQRQVTSVAVEEKRRALQAVASNPELMAQIEAAVKSDGDGS